MEDRAKGARAQGAAYSQHWALADHQRKECRAQTTRIFQLEHLALCDPAVGHPPSPPALRAQFREQLTPPHPCCPFVATGGRTNPVGWGPRLEELAMHPPLLHVLVGSLKVGRPLCTTTHAGTPPPHPHLEMLGHSVAPTTPPTSALHPPERGQRKSQI